MKDKTLTVEPVVATVPPVCKDGESCSIENWVRSCHGQRRLEQCDITGAA